MKTTTLWRNITAAPAPKREFLKQTDEHKISRIFYHPSPPLKGGHLLGTNTQGADILAYLYGGLQVNMKAALFYLPIVYFIGITFGMMMGYFGGMFDLGMQRLIEIFSQVPFLFIIMIISDMVPLHMKGMFLIISLLIMFGWMSMTYQLRTSTMKEKARDYVAAVIFHLVAELLFCFYRFLSNFLQACLLPFFRQHQFRCRIQRNLFQILYGTLALRLKASQGINGISPHFNTQWIFFRQRIYIKDSSTHRKFSRHFHLIIAHIPHLQKPLCLCLKV